MSTFPDIIIPVYCKKKAAINPTVATSDAIGALSVLQAPDSESEPAADAEVESAAG